MIPPYLEREAVLERALSLDVAQAVSDILVDAAVGAAGQAVRTELVPPGMPGLMGYMPAYRIRSPRLMSAKIVSVVPGNPERGMPSHHGVAVLFDGDTGEPIGFAEAGAVTEIRTAAMTLVATRALARRDRKRHLMIGTGHQAHAHLRCFARHDPGVSLAVWGRDARSVSALADRAAAEGITVEVAPRLAEAAQAADVVTTLTAARAPILMADWVSPGTHVNAVGSSSPAGCEFGEDLVGRASVFADHRESVIGLAGEFTRLRQHPDIVEIGDVLSERAAGRSASSQVTLFKSVGVALLDLALLERLFPRLKGSK